ncbi:MAG: hypothetical protein M1820_010733 [Bogoriella megaspora]|nr:MAG: hypothetical protein M1820_010733 [Bogoriella megaspora]
MPDIQDQFGNKVKVACAACIPTAKCASGAIQAIASSPKESPSSKPHVPSNTRLKRLHQQRVNGSVASTPASKAENALKQEYFEDYPTSGSTADQIPPLAPVSCCGRKPVEDDDAPSPADSVNLSANSSQQPTEVTGTLEATSNTRLAEPFDFLETGYNSKLDPRLERDKQRIQANVLHDPANNGLDSNGFQHGCNCGPGCVCLGCAAHPQNATTLQYVKELYEYQADDADETGSVYGLASPKTGRDLFSQSNFDQALAGFPTGQDILPPDLYFPFQLNLPGCENGGCRCGVNCTCQGCLTHSGHNGISTEFEIPANFDAYALDNNTQNSAIPTPIAQPDNWNDYGFPSGLAQLPIHRNSLNGSVNSTSTPAATVGSQPFQHFSRSSSYNPNIPRVPQQSVQPNMGFRSFAGPTGKPPTPGFNRRSSVNTPPNHATRLPNDQQSQSQSPSQQSCCDSKVSVQQKSIGQYHFTFRASFFLFGQDQILALKAVKVKLWFLTNLDL